MNFTTTVGSRASTCTVILSLSLWLTACGGGGSDAPEPPKATPLPDLSITVPPAGDVAQAVSFSTSVTLGAGLKASWEFGDGTSSTEATPRHAYAKAGDYEVRLTLTNETGQSRQYRQSFVLNRLAATKGLQCAKADETGWCWQLPQPTGNAVTWVNMVDDKAGWRIGDGGEVFRTLDGGKTWTRRRTPTSVMLTTVYPVSADEAWIVGASSTLLHTTDGGATWKVASTPLDLPYSGSSLQLQEDGGLAIRNPNGGGITAFYSPDGGQSWLPRLVPDANGGDYNFDGKGRLWVVKGEALVRLDLKSGDQATATTFPSVTDPSGWPMYVDRAMYVAGDIVVWAQNGQYFDGNFVQKHRGALQLSLDGGKTWKTQTFTLPQPLGYFRLLSVDPTGTRMAAQFGMTPVYSVDGGATWTISKISEELYGGVTGTCANVSGGRFMCVGGFQQLTMITPDMGATWSVMAMPVGMSNAYFQMRMRSLRNGDVQLYAEGGETFLYNGSANSWTQISSTLRTFPQSVVRFTDASNGLMLQAGNHLYATTDGGATWKEQALPTNLSQGYTAPVLTRLGNDKIGMITGGGQMILSSDQGKTWVTPAELPPNMPYGGFSNLSFQDEKFQWAMPTYRNNFQVLISTDGAAHWRSVLVPLDSIGGVYRNAAGRLTVVGERGLVLQSDDEGKTWFYRHSGEPGLLRALYSLDGQRMWAVGDNGAALLSTDGGVTWTQMEIGTRQSLTDVRFVDADHGWVVGDRGLVLATRDGGKSWQFQASATTQNLLHIEAVDTRTAWITGEQGAVLVTGTAGY